MQYVQMRPDLFSATFAHCEPAKQVCLFASSEFFGDPHTSTDPARAVSNRVSVSLPTVHPLAEDLCMELA